MEDRTLLQNIRTTTKLSLPVLIFSKLVVMVLPLAQIGIGEKYLYNCPKQPNIPIFVLVSGVFNLVLVILSCLPCAQEPEDGSSSTLSSLCTAWNSLISLFLFCWFITGNVWIYSIYPPSYDPKSPDYCAKPLYLFAFWTTNLVYIAIGLLLVGGCCVLFCMCLCGRAGLTNSSHDEV